MDRKALNPKELGEEGGGSKPPESEAEKAGEGTVKKPAKKPVKKTVKRRTRAKKVVKEVRLKAFWGVFNQSLRRLALFEYNEREQADKKAEELSKSQKNPHFVQLVKEVIEE